MTEFTELREAVSSHISRAAEKLRRQNSSAKILSVFIHTNRFKNTAQTYDSASVKFLSATQSTFKLIKFGIDILEYIFKPGFEYKKCGIVLSDIYNQSESQFDLFSENDNLKEILILNSIDKYNLTNGPESIKIASCGISKHWKMMSNMKTKPFTTSIHSLLSVF